MSHLERVEAGDPPEPSAAQPVSTSRRPHLGLPEVPPPRHVAVTHADSPLGRKLVRKLLLDPSIKSVRAAGTEAPPHPFRPYLDEANPRLAYRRLDLSHSQGVAELFRFSTGGDCRAAADSRPDVRGAAARAIDTVIHIPPHARGAEASLDGGEPTGRLFDSAAETRCVLRQCLKTTEVRRLIAIGSAYVYRLSPGCSSRLHEGSEVILDDRQPQPLGGWVESDRLIHNEVCAKRLSVALLRVPTIVASDGSVYLNPVLEPGQARQPRPLLPIGFDPLCPLVADHDLVRAILLALGSRRAGVYNIAGHQNVPMSVLIANRPRPARLPLPSSLAMAGQVVTRWVEATVGLEGSADPTRGGEPPETSRLDATRYGYSLDTRRAQRELGFEPGYRVVWRRGPDPDQGPAMALQPA